MWTSSKMFLLWLIMYTQFSVVQLENKLCYPEGCLPDPGNNIPSNSLFNRSESDNCLCCSLTKNDSKNLSCHQVLTFKEKYFMQDRCKDGWSNLLVKQLCEHDINLLQDPLTNIPVTSSSNTYKNVFCAICNNDQNISFWDIRILCDKTNISTLRDLLHYDNIKGLWQFNDSLNISFSKCETKIHFPKNYKSEIHSCISTIDTCSENWTDRQIAEQCGKYESYISYKSSESTYKNIFCALCNYVKMDHLYCYPSRTARIEPEYDGYPILMDLDFISNGNIVGETSRCSEGQLFDPFTNHCRVIMCKENYEIKNMKCILKTNNHVTMKNAECLTYLELSKKIEIFDNKSLFLNATGEIYRPEDYTIRPEQIIICKEFYKKIDTKPCEDIVDTLIITSQSNEQYSRETINDQMIIYNSSKVILITCTPIFNQENNTMNTTSTCLTIKLEKYDINLFDNGTLIRTNNERTKIYNPGEYFFNDGNILVCASNNDGRPMPRYLWYVTVTCLSTSLFCLLLHFIIYVIFSELHNFPGKNLASLVIALFLAQLSFIVSFVLQPFHLSCQIIGILMHFCYLATFSWESAIGFDMWQAFSFYDGLYSKDHKNIKFLQYSCFAWGLPLLIVSVAVIIDKALPFSEFHPHYGEAVCWISQRKSLIIFFALPIAFLLLVNITFFSLTAYNINRTLKSTRIVQKERKSCCSTYAKLLVVTGLPWILAFIATYIHLEPLWYLFTIGNALQGVFIFQAFTCSTTVRKIVKDQTVRFFIMKTCRKESCSSIRSLTSKDSLTTKSSILSVESLSS